MDKIIYLILRIASYFIDVIGVYYLGLYVFKNFSYYAYPLALLSLFIYRILTSYYLGATIGMKILGLKLDKNNIKTVFKREIYRIACRPLYIGYLFSAFNIRNQCLHDYMAGCEVLYIPKKQREACENNSEDNKKSNSINTLEKEINKNIANNKKKSRNNKKTKNKGNKYKDKRKKYLIIITGILMVIAVLSFLSKFFLSHVGLIGFKKIATSTTYTNNNEKKDPVEGEGGLLESNLNPSKETVLSINGEDKIIRISNKNGKTEFYRIDIKGNELIGSHIFTLENKIESIETVGNEKNLIIALTKGNELFLINEKGTIIDNIETTLENIVALKSGKINNNKEESIVIISSSGEGEILKIEKNKLKREFKGKLGEDIKVNQFIVDDCIYILSEGGDNDILYEYCYKEDALKYIKKRTIKIEHSEIFEKIKLKNGEYFLFSTIKKPNFLLNTGKIQISKVYSKNGKLEYELGERLGALYKYSVRKIEKSLNLNGQEYLLIKSIVKGETNQENYKLELYAPNEALLKMNFILTKIKTIFRI